MKRVRCAIYTRKSSEEGLEQGFNSLDAQREACAAYVLSQASEGWQLLPDIYDDGGISGGTLDRPALQRLLGEVAAGRVDIIVVYKVDRLTRSLLDFARLVEAFDRAGTSFVSITQSFNTTTSMGRLTLNMLLSFAQFEREVTAERIRDKIAASKARGMWMGGTPPLGYRPDGRSLAIVGDDAALIRDIYRRYLALGNVRMLAGQLEAEGIRTPRRETRGSGRSFGGGVFSRGQLYTILRNPVYAGDIPHRGHIWPGLHEAIVDRPTWDAVQARLADNIRGQRSATDAHHSLLAGRIVDGAGEPLVATHACKGSSRYRYYVSRSLQHGTAGSAKAATEPGSSGGGSAGSGPAPGLRLPAREIEGIVAGTVAGLFDDPLDLAERASLAVTGAALPQLAQRCAAIAAELRQRDTGRITQLVRRVRVLGAGVEIELYGAGIAAACGLAPARDAPAFVTVPLAVRLTRTGRAMRLVHDNGAAATVASDDAALVRLVARGRQWWGELCSSGLDIRALAAREGVTASWMTRVVRLAFLSPAVTEAALAGKLRAGASAVDLFGGAATVPEWGKQATLLLPGGAVPSPVCDKAGR